MSGQARSVDSAATSSHPLSLPPSITCHALLSVPCMDKEGHHAPARKKEAHLLCDAVVGK